MQKQILILVLICVPFFINAQSLAVNTDGTTAHPNALVDIKGTNKGLLIPRGNAATRTALNANTAKGLLMYDTVLNTVWMHNGNALPTGWNSLATGTNYWELNGALGTEIKNTNAGGFWSANATTVAVFPPVIQPPVSGAGTRMIWIPQRSAFRVGTVTGNNWNADSIGAHSFATGYNTKAKGDLSTALGFSTSATGEISTAMGSATFALGDNSFAIGNGVIAQSYSSVAMGEYNDFITTSNPTTSVPNDPLLILGNGVGAPFIVRSNALVVYKNGNTDINGYTQLGKTTDGSPAIKIKKLTLNTSGSQGVCTFIAHGLTQSKILSISGLATVPGGFQIIPNHIQAGFQYTLNVDNANIAVCTVAGNSGSILNATVKIVIVYEE
jgi:Head domain of trimeric autotransporter adhesin